MTSIIVIDDEQRQRDIIKTILSICEYESLPPRMTPELIDEACNCYFVESHQATP